MYGDHRIANFQWLSKLGLGQIIDTKEVEFQFNKIVNILHYKTPGAKGFYNIIGSGPETSQKHAR